MTATQSTSAHQPPRRTAVDRGCGARRSSGRTGRRCTDPSSARRTEPPASGVIRDAGRTPYGPMGESILPVLDEARAIPGVLAGIPPG